MLLRIYPAEITRHWFTLIAPAIAASVPPTVSDDPEVMANILESLVADRMQCWKAEKNVDGEPRIMGLLVTTVTSDLCTGQQNLLVFAVYSYRFMDYDFWEQGYEELQGIAQAYGCSKIVAYTANPRVLDVVERLGGSSEYRLVTLPVEERQVSRQMVLAEEA